MKRQPSCPAGEAAYTTAAHADDLFRSRLENLIDLSHPLATWPAQM